MTPDILAAGGVLLGLAVSARWNWWRPPVPGLPVLMYHKVGVPPPGSRLNKLWVSPRRFAAQLDYLSRRGYQSLTFADIKKLKEEGKPLPPKPVVITFDDGYRNNYTQAFPLMKEKGFRGVIFLVVQAIGWDNNWHDPATETRIPMLTWTQAEEMKKAGFEFGSHTLTHPNLENLERNQATEEIAKSRRVLGEFLGREPVSFAYPYGVGQDNARLREEVRSAGYDFGIGIHQGKADLKGDLYCLRRIFVRGDDTLFDFHLNMTRGKARF